MYYNQYLVLLSQFTYQDTAKILIDDIEIFVEKDVKRGTWKLKSRIATPDNSLRESFSSLGKFAWQTQDFYLQNDRDSDAFYLVQNSVSISKYLSFKRVMENFMHNLSLWQDFPKVFSRVVF